MVVLIVTALSAAALAACAGMSRAVYRCCVQPLLRSEVMNGIERDREEQVAVRKDEERKRERLGEESREKTGQCEAIRRELGSKDAFKKHKAVTEEDFEAASESFGRDFYRTVNLGVVGYTGTGKSSLINSLREMRCTDRGEPITCM